MGLTCTERVISSGFLVNSRVPTIIFKPPLLRVSYPSRKMFTYQGATVRWRLFTKIIIDWRGLSYSFWGIVYLIWAYELCMYVLMHVGPDPPKGGFGRSLRKSLTFTLGKPKSTYLTCALRQSLNNIQYHKLYPTSPARGSLFSARLKPRLIYPVWGSSKAHDPVRETVLLANDIWTSTTTTSSRSRLKVSSFNQAVHVASMKVVTYISAHIFCNLNLAPNPPYAVLV